MGTLIGSYQMRVNGKLMTCRVEDRTNGIFIEYSSEEGSKTVAYLNKKNKQLRKMLEKDDTMSRVVLDGFLFLQLGSHKIIRGYE